MKSGDHVCIINGALGDFPTFGKVIAVDDIQDVVLIKVFHTCVWIPQNWCRGLKETFAT